MRLCIDQTPVLKTAFLYDHQSKKLSKWIVDNPFRAQVNGNIYYGKVVQIAQHLGGCFVDIGLSQNAFYKWNTLEAVCDTTKLKCGDFVFGQVSKEPYQTKGALLSSNISVRGKNIVYLPYDKGVKFSKKNKHVADIQKNLNAIESVLDQNDGVIIRTNAGRDMDAILEEIQTLKSHWEAIVSRANLEKKIKCIYEANDFWREVIELIDRHAVDQITVNTQEHVDLLKKSGIDKAIIEKVSGGMACYQQCHLPIRDMIEAEMFNHESGISIVVNELEAFCVVDVNSDKFVTLQKDPFKVNAIASELIDEVLQLKRISGAIVIDYLSMSAKEINQFEKTVIPKVYKSSDGYRGQGFTKLGLYELTKIREKPSLKDLLSFDFRAFDLGYWKLFELYFELNRLAYHTNTKKVTVSIAESLYIWLKNNPIFDVFDMEIKFVSKPEISSWYNIKTIDNNMEM